jgi:serine phosphatase RsbU (regulator of sigma subunit)/anti-sigma regulatory factor (Ser/Thr protein kinase)
MIAWLTETFEIQLQPILEAVHPALERIGIHFRLLGLPEEQWRRLELGIVEGLNNAIIHGSSTAKQSPVTVRLSWSGDVVTVEIRDPGFFEPGAQWGELPEDPLAESGRGGFLMKQTFAQVEHRNDQQGHILRLSTSVGRLPADATAIGEVREAVNRAASELENAYETVAGLRHLVSLLAKSNTPSELIEPALARLHQIDDFSFAYVRMVRRTQLEFERGWGPLPKLPPAVSLGDDTAESRAILTLTTQRFESCDDLGADDPLLGVGGPVVISPICYESERIGTLTVVRAHGEPFFRAGTVALLHTLAEFFGVACATAQLQARERDLEFSARELAVASEMQRRLLPATFPPRSDLRFSGVCRSARSVGGDFYDVFAVDGGTLVVIADAMGKGVPAAFVASVLRCAIRARTHQAGNPGLLLSEVNRQIIADLLAVDIFITTLVAFFPADSHQVRLASAGHCPLMIRRRSGEVTVIEGTGMPLGVLADADYNTTTVLLETGDAAVLYTDGLYEIGPAENLHLGLSWLRDAVAGTSGQNAEGTIAELLEAARARGDSRATGDDRTLLVCERTACTPQPAATPTS